MSLQICPKCRTKSITWFIDEEASPYTIWDCSSCSYTAQEDETKVSDCPKCGSKKGLVFIRDAQGFQHWCPECSYFHSSVMAEFDRLLAMLPNGPPDEGDEWPGSLEKPPTTSGK
jgi:hypothetical protein